MVINYEVLKDLSADEKKIINVIQKNGYMSKSQISFYTNIKLATLNYLINGLERKGLIQKCIGESTGGRKPILYDINICKFYIIGIDISQKYIQVVIANMRLEILYKEEFRIEPSYGLNEIIIKITEIISNAYSDLRLELIQLLGIGVGCMLGHSLSEKIKQRLVEKYKCLVMLENSTNAAIIAEYFYGIGKGYKSISYFNCGFEFRSSAIFSGKLFRTGDDDEDIFGHMIIDSDGERCKCGNFGCIECYSSINSIIRNTVSEIKKGRNSILEKNLENIYYKDICKASEKNDELAKEVITDAALMLGTGLSNYINMFNPDIIVLNGLLVDRSKMFYEICISNALKKINVRKTKKIVFSQGGFFKENAVSIGAAALVMEKYFDSTLL